MGSPDMERREAYRFFAIRIAAPDRELGQFIVCAPSCAGLWEKGKVVVIPCAMQRKALLCRHVISHGKFEFAVPDPVLAVHHFVLHGTRNDGKDLEHNTEKKFMKKRKSKQPNQAPANLAPAGKRRRSRCDPAKRGARVLYEHGERARLFAYHVIAPTMMAAVARLLGSSSVSPSGFLLRLRAVLQGRAADV